MKYLSTRQLYRRSPNGRERDQLKECSVGSQTYLPYEIICGVLSQLDQERAVHHAPWFFTKTVLQPTLFVVCLLSKGWNEAASCLLYRDVFISTTRSLTSLSLTLLKRKHLRPWVRSVFFTRAYMGSGDEWRSFGDWWDLERIYTICPNIQSWTAKARTTPSSRFPRAFLVLELRHHLLLRRKMGPESLTRLELQSFNCSPDTFFPPTLSLLALEDLTLKGFTYEVTTESRLKWPCMPRLRRLCLYQCDFVDDSISLPSFQPENSSLRALEIVGGSYMSEDIWTEITRIGKALELLTFAPSYVTKRPYDGELLGLPSLVLLRLDVVCFVNLSLPWRRPIVLPPRLVHLVTFETPYHTCPSVSVAQECVLEIIKRKRRGRHAARCMYLETIRVNGKVSKSMKEKQTWLTKEAESSGIRFSIFNSNSKVFDGLAAFFHWLSPVF